MIAGEDPFGDRLCNKKFSERIFSWTVGPQLWPLEFFIVTAFSLGILLAGSFFSWPLDLWAN